MSHAERNARMERLLEGIIPPPMPTVQDAVRDLDGAGQKLTVATVQARLRQLRGFDASPAEITKELRRYREMIGQCAGVMFMAGANALHPETDGRMLREMLAKRWKLHAEELANRRQADGNDAGTG